ncbi:hypothetical protein PGTUg99_015835 [Puccinia graminis f. sp. tritici]|uniref:Uncharacterized protein n=1 Tax=Puccinia graminis f. sp. tritici TaxID=56615 RepID=A0A5B0SD28_PUCGR|nr:hypothetical protein PGTUg99_015835 [Puccinia graminis f. sp. tritici]
MFTKNVLNLFLILGIIKAFPLLLLPFNQEVTRSGLGNGSSAASQIAQSTASRETHPTLKCYYTPNDSYNLYSVSRSSADG